MSITASLPLIGDVLTGPEIDLWDNFFFYRVDDDQFNQAQSLANQISKISRGKKTRIFSPNSEIVGKVGEFVVREYCKYYIEGPWKSMVEEVNPKGGDRYDLLVYGKLVDVKTRELHNDRTVSPSFDLRVTASSQHRYQDFFVLAGFSTISRYGYVFGWCTWDELMAYPVRTDIRYPARCVPLQRLHPIQTFEPYLKGLGTT